MSSHTRGRGWWVAAISRVGHPSRVGPFASAVQAASWTVENRPPESGDWRNIQIVYNKGPRTKTSKSKNSTVELCRDSDLWNALEGCTGHVVPAIGGGLRCTKCSGWYCY